MVGIVENVVKFYKKDNKIINSCGKKDKIIMRTISIAQEIKLFRFDELSEQAKNKAITDNINSLWKLPEEKLSDNVKKGIDKAEYLKTPWFINGYVFDYAKDEIIEDLKQYEFLEDGTWYSYMPQLK